MPLLAESKKLQKLSSSEDYAQAETFLARITKGSNTLEKLRKDLGEPFLEATRIIKAVSDDAREPLEMEKRRLQAALAAYHVEERHKADEARRQAEMEARKEAERKAAEQQAEEEARKVLGLDDEPQVEQPPVPVVQVVPVVQEPPRSSKTRVTEILAFKILDVEKVPRAFLMVDESKVRSWLNANKETVRKQLSENPNGAEIIQGLTIKLEINVISNGR